MAHKRVVRFTDVSPERLDGVKQRIEGGGSPPEGAKVKSVEFFHDADQNTMLVVQSFDSAEDMAASEEAFNSMDSEKTPGTRASVDRCEKFGEITL